MLVAIGPECLDERVSIPELHAARPSVPLELRIEQEQCPEQILFRPSESENQA